MFLTKRKIVYLTTSNVDKKMENIIEGILNKDYIISHFCGEIEINYRVNLETNNIYFHSPQKLIPFHVACSI